MKNLTSRLVRASALTLALVASVAVNSAVTAHEHEAKLSFKTTEVTPGIYMLSGEGGFTGGNIGLIAGDDGVVMIDNGIPQVLDMLRTEITKTTKAPIDYLINTHVHGDHTGNNFGFGSDGAQIISHENLRSTLKKEGIGRGDDFEAAPKASLPVMTFSDQMTLHINGDAANIIHVENAHTDGDAVIRFENANVIHTGDVMFNGLFPFIDGKHGGTAKGMIAAMKKIASLSDNNTKVIPGHGPLANKADVEKTIAMLEDAHSLVAAMVKEGKSDEAILKANPLSKYDTYSWNFITTELMTKQLLATAR